MDTWNTPPGEVPQGIYSGSTTLTTCNGKINSDGVCLKCFEVSQTTSAYCTRLIEEPTPDPLPEDIDKDAMINLLKENKSLRETLSNIHQSAEVNNESDEITKLREENETLKKRINILNKEVEALIQLSKNYYKKELELNEEKERLIDSRYALSEIEIELIDTWRSATHCVNNSKFSIAEKRIEDCKKILENSL